MRFRLAVLGNLQRTLRQEYRDAATAMAGAVKASTEGLKHELRTQVRNAGLGTRLANAWRSRFYRNDGINAAGVVYSKAPKIHRVFDQGAVIRSRNGFWLAVPTDAAPRRGMAGKKITPSNFPEHRYGPLRFVYRPGKPALLVVDGMRARTGRQRGRFMRASARAQRTGEGLTTVVMFILYPQVTIAKRLDVDRAVSTWQARLPQLVAQYWPRPRREAA